LINNINMTVKTVFIIGFVLHGLSCCYVFIGIEHYIFDHENYQSWIVRFNLQETTPFEIYATALKFTTDTVTTIGYGDIYSLTNVEKIYTCFLIYIGMIVFAMIR
jgi:voltage-gated potassium channel Kch